MSLGSINSLRYFNCTQSTLEDILNLGFYKVIALPSNYDVTNQWAQVLQKVTMGCCQNNRT